MKITLIKIMFFLCMAYAGFAFMVFQWRNPLANKMSFYRDFVSVMRFEKLPGYQPTK
jgi:hypothetical protein